MHDNSNNRMHSEGEEIEEGTSKRELLERSREKFKLEESIYQSHKLIKSSQKVYVGTGFTFNLHEFFKVNKSSKVQVGSIFDQLSSGGVSWLILMYSVINASLIPVWILSAEQNKFVALAWKFFLHSFLMIPFVLYQKRTQYNNLQSFWPVIQIKKIKRVFEVSITMSIWYLIILTAGQWTSLSHAFYFGALPNFFLSLARHRNQNVHKFEIGGQLLIVIGMLFAFYDTFTMQEQKIEPYQLQAKNHFYLLRTRSQRLIADLICLLTSLFMSRFYAMHSSVTLSQTSYLSILLTNIMTAIFMVFTAYFTSGMTFDTSDIWGLFSIFNSEKSAMFLCSAIILCSGLVISFHLIARMIPNFVLPAFAFFCEPGFVTFFLHLSNIQIMPGAFSLIGYTAMTPGMLLLLLGQWMFVKNKKMEEAMQKIHYIELDQICNKTSLQTIKSMIEIEEQEQGKDKQMESSDQQENKSPTKSTKLPD